MGIDKRSSSATRASLNKISRTYSEKIVELETEIQTLKRLHGQVKKDADSEKASTAEKVASDWNEFYKNINIEFDHSQAELENTQKTYQSFMELKAPHDYWSKKKTEHSDRKNWFGGLAVLWGIGGSIGLVYVLWELFAYEMKLSAGEVVPTVQMLLLLSSIGLVVSTVFFWIARILVRLFLSELHLGMDAHERVTMVQCYLALTEDGKVDASERKLVLTSLFRPTQDGIVKDDASADPTLIGLLGKLGK